jgi:SAM-dependent methyltransferase
MPSATPDTVTAYNTGAGELAARYEAMSAAEVHAGLADLIPCGPGLALDVGAGSGRDAAWLAGLGYEVVAVEPATGMRSEGQRRHPSLGLRWLDDRLPDLAAVHQLGLAFDLILVSAVWMHVPPPARTRAFRKLMTLLKPGGVLLITLRHGPSEPNRPMWPATAGEVEALARQHGLAVVRSVGQPDRLGRPEITWTAICLRLPDDGAGVLPLLRGVILNDEKSSTYKLGLLRAVARIADAAPSLATDRLGEEDAVEVPLGLVALNWVRAYLPLVTARLPQAPGNAGPDGLGFAKAGFRALVPLGVIAQDLWIGARFRGEHAAAVAKALTEAARTITIMPANFTRYPNSEARVFTAMLGRAPRPCDELVLDAEMLRAYGILTVPGHIWRAMQRLGAWIEPVLVAEWARLVRGYGERMGRTVVPGEVEQALAWLDPVRDTRIARNVAQHLLDAGVPVRCVWSGTRLGAEALDIDHCLPWSAWPCGDLWNLLPASRRVNQRLKRDRLPSAAALAAAQEAVVDWWAVAWRADPLLSRRFDREAAAALPVQAGASFNDVFAALEWRRLRLRQDQQVEEWTGIRPAEVRPCEE